MTLREEPGAPGLGDLEPGTAQRAQLRSRIADIAWTALLTVLAIWAVWASVGALRQEAAWAHGIVAWILLAVALTMRLVAARRRTRL